MTNDETLNKMVAIFPSTFVIRALSSLYIQIANVERVVFDELAARLDDVAH
jgi:hypothetical protein